ncbi:MAG: hypothetical protein HY097_02970 [Nitrospinae bacterium]|nr:hypothetical protein [Nitrospinota bacterium]MBI3815070.1 hypothetical protein [Nitrospinota bacterium]
MKNVIPFEDVLEAADRLSMEEQETLIEILHRRMIEHRRAELAKDIQDAQQELREGCCRPITPEEIMKEIVS